MRPLYDSCLLCLCLICLFPTFLSQDYLYKFDKIYNGTDPFICAGAVCAVANFIGAKIQTFPLMALNLYNPDYMPCGLEFELIRISELDANSEVIKTFEAQLTFPQRLYYTQPTIYNFTYCDPQLEGLSTTSTGSPIQPVTSIFDAEFYPSLNCTPISAFLSSMQAVITNGSRFDPPIGVLSVDVSVFTSQGAVVNTAKNESQIVSPGDVRINLTLSRWQWSGYNFCAGNKQKAEFLELIFSIGGKKEAEKVDKTLEFGYGTNSVYDFESGLGILSGIAVRDEKIVSCIPKWLEKESPVNNNYFRIRTSRFDNFFQYEGILLRQNPEESCEMDDIIGTPEC